MANGTTLVGIHGALRGDGTATSADYFYRDVCQRRLGVRWVPYAESDFRRPLHRRNTTGNAWDEARQDNSYSVARIDRLRFVKFFERVLSGELDTLLDEYAAQLDLH